LPPNGGADGFRRRFGANISLVTPKTIVSYGLLGGNECPSCGRPKLARLFALSRTGCEECDEVITRHRCAGRPASDDVFPGTRWKCPQCASVWMAREHAESCGECGQEVVRRCWDVTDDRRAEGPRVDPQLYTPFRMPEFAARMAAEREAEERDRREWVNGVGERLGLVPMKGGS
jgi:uncharacterized protein (DUF983 family)